ncbi:MAG: histidine phosphatase family protein [Acidovorax sp.]|uniref:histidine phosphatase family protein n=1 Tax=Acidovorax sp. TaxID=1872122 RepID=UPI0039E6EAA5
MTRLWLVRHARPLVAPGLCYGALDVPVDAMATQLAARRLAAALPPGAQVAHSTLQRCEQLAQALQALQPDLALNADARLREMDFGTWEGQPWHAIGQDAVDAWTADFATHAPGGGESLGAMLERVAQALRDVPAATDVVWITHAGVARCVAWLQTQGDAPPRADAWPLAAPGYGEWEVRRLG